MGPGAPPGPGPGPGGAWGPAPWGPPGPGPMPFCGGFCDFMGSW